MTQKLISIVIPVLNEAGNLDALIARVAGVLGQIPERWEIVFVDDGSTDGTLARLREIHTRDSRIAAISFSRNFGKELAIAAGLTYVRGDAAIIMDADLQHPPEVALQFVEKWRGGYDIVYGDRVDRNTDGPFRKLYAKAFYRLFNFLSRSDIPSGAGDFRLHLLHAARRKSSAAIRGRIHDEAAPSAGARRSRLRVVRRTEVMAQFVRDDQRAGRARAGGLA